MWYFFRESDRFRPGTAFRILARDAFPFTPLRGRNFQLLSEAVHERNSTNDRGAIAVLAFALAALEVSNAIRALTLLGARALVPEESLHILGRIEIVDGREEGAGIGEGEACSQRDTEGYMSAKRVREAMNKCKWNSLQSVDSRSITNEDGECLTAIFGVAASVPGAFSWLDVWR